MSGKPSDDDGLQTVKLGIRNNLSQFIVQLILVFFVGIIVGLERNIIPKSAEEEFGISNFALIMTFVISFGVVKAVLNLYGGRLSERYGRKRILIIGWLIAIPIPIMIILATSWYVIILANLLLGANQGLAWSMTVTSKIDLAGKKWRGFAIGVNEWAGYTGVAVAALVGGYLAENSRFDSIRTGPFLFGLVIILLANLVTILFAKETIHYARKEKADAKATLGDDQIDLTFNEIFWLATFKDRTLFASSQAGLIEKFVDVIVWVGFPLYFTTFGTSLEEMGVIVASYGFSWGFLQLLTGPISDRIGRKPMIFTGMVISGIGTFAIVLFDTLFAWIVISIIIGIGMAFLYPTLLAVVSDMSDPVWRATSLGVYRMGRDAGYAIGALMIGVTMQVLGIKWGFYLTGVLMIISAILVWIFMDETEQDTETKPSTG